MMVHLGQTKTKKQPKQVLHITCSESIYVTPEQCRCEMSE